MATIQESLQSASSALTAVSDTPLLDAEILLAHVLQTSRITLRMAPAAVLSAHDLEQFTALVSRRLKRVPIAYLTGRKEFWSLDLDVNEHTLVPRPETELLVETALALFDAGTTIKAADLGTGSGAIALALASERPHWRIDAVDISQSALHIARNNAQRLGLANISFYLGSWFTALPAVGYDLVLANPPYITEVEWPLYAEALAGEPRLALVSGDDGLEALRHITGTARQYIRRGGYLICEHGVAQGAAVRALLVVEGCKEVRTLNDLGGRERITLGQF